MQYDDYVLDEQYLLQLVLLIYLMKNVCTCLFDAMCYKYNSTIASLQIFFAVGIAMYNITLAHVF